jgi:hypothetical protein
LLLYSGLLLSIARIAWDDTEKLNISNSERAGLSHDRRASAMQNFAVFCTIIAVEVSGFNSTR